MVLDKSLLKSFTSNIGTRESTDLKSYKLTRKNIEFIKVAYTMGNIVCITPWHDFTEKNFVYPAVNRVYAVLIAVVLISIFLSTIRAREFIDEQMVHKFLVTFSDVISVVLTVFSIIQATFFKKEKWKILLQKFSDIDDKLENNHKEQYKIFSNFYWQLLMGHVFFLGCYIYKAYVWSHILGIQYYFNFGTMVIPMYYCFFSAVLLSNLALALHCRYKDLNEMLEKKAETGQTSENNFIKDVTLIRKYYRHLGDTVEVFNDIFGWIVVLIVLHAIIELLNCVNLILRSFVDPTFCWRVFTSCLWVCSLSMGGTIYIILCCDSAASEGRRMVRLCYKHQEKFGVSSNSSQELLKLADFCKNYSPNFLAANFFIVERSTILGIISIATTYLIVVIQFNGALSKNY